MGTSHLLLTDMGYSQDLVSLSLPGLVWDQEQDLTMGWYSWNFRPGPSCLGMAVLGAFGGSVQLGRKTGSITSLGAVSLAKKQAR